MRLQYVPAYPIFCLPGHFISPIYTWKSPRDCNHRFSFSPIAVYTSTVKLSNLSSFEHNLNIMNEKKSKFSKKEISILRD